MSARLGIIGAGQLGLYLAQAADRLGIDIVLWSGTEDAPALGLAAQYFVGPLDDLSIFDKFVASCDTVTFEREDIPDETLDRLLQAEQQGDVTVGPGAGILMLLKDKGRQKSWLASHQLPTLPFRVFPGGEPAGREIPGDFGDIIVQKACQGGFDGRGVQIIKRRDAPAALWRIPSVIEPFLAGCTEISVLTVRSISGELQSYPPVSMEFDTGLNSVSLVAMPASVDSETKNAAVRLAEKTVALLGGVGVFAIEMFITGDGELLINEISPRVHNSGHLTLDACNVSQFEMHVRAVQGLPLVEISQLSPGAMLNILYTDALRGICPDKPVTDHRPDSGTTVYWYGKMPGSIGRKMGHINTVASTVSRATELASDTLAGLASNNPEKV
ncbi:MAG: ATP-grasp domain-containing protein [Pseudomonadales bacterium]